MTKPNLLGLDISTHTGWACRYQDGEETVYDSGHEDIADKHDQTLGIRFAKYRSWVKKLFDRVNPTFVVIERLFIPNGRGQGAKLLLGLESMALELCGERGIDHVSVAPSTLKKFLTGNGKAQKPEMMKIASQKWPLRRRFTDDNEADAVAALLWAEGNLE